MRHTLKLAASATVLAVSTLVASHANAGALTTLKDVYTSEAYAASPALGAVGRIAATNPDAIQSDAYLKTTGTYTDPIYLPTAAQRNGTVVIRTPIPSLPGFGSFCSGTVISPTHVLTAAHCVSEAFLSGDLGTPNVRFGGSNLGTDNRQDALNVYVHPDYYATEPLLGAFARGDIAIITLSNPVPVGTKIYGLYTGNPLGEVATHISYGTTGNGNGTGGDVFTADNLANGRIGTNKYEITLRSLFGASFSSGQLLYDFDDGTAVRNGFDFWLSALDADGDGNIDLNPDGSIKWTPGSMTGIPAAFASLITDLGTGITEVLIDGGDSGGGAFIGDLVAGVHSFGFSLGGEYCDGKVNPNPADPFDTGGAFNPEITPQSDIDCALNSTFGEVAGDTSVAFYARWIQAVLNGTIGAGAVVLPEPSTISLLGLGLLGFGLARRRRQA